MSGHPDDERLMRLALALGYRNLGRTWPNPSVGAVIAAPDSGRIIATGSTDRGGRPHAERVALALAGEGARGATLYVSLEPCSHHGRTPPCAEAVVAAGIARVVTALADADPRVAGRGHAMIREAGLAIRTGLLADQAARDHRGHLTRVRAGRPAVTVKLARTADGLATGEGGRLMITGEGANARTHLLRAHADAVMVGVSTILQDDPMLTVRLPGMDGRSPLRIVADTNLRTPTTAHVVRTAGVHPTWILCGPSADPARAEQLRKAGTTVLRVEANEKGRLDLGKALQALAERGLTRVFCEGGPRLADALAENDLVDEAVIMTSKHGSRRPGRPALGPHLSAALTELLAHVSDEQVGDDRVETFERAS